jgi:hypothetical protein
LQNKQESNIVNSFIAFFVNVPKLDRIADAEEQIKIGSEHLNKGSLDMVTRFLGFLG